MTTYYFAGSQRVAVNDNGTLYWLLGDHLGSTSITANSSGGFYSELRYKPYGETRYTNGTTPTRHQFTGQITDSYINLYEMGARWYDPTLGRFLSADMIVPNPNSPQAFNRYSYSYNNPIRYFDPSGNRPACGVIDERCDAPSLDPLIAQLEKEYGVEILGTERDAAQYGVRVLTQGDIANLHTAFAAMQKLFGRQVFARMFGHVSFRVETENDTQSPGVYHWHNNPDTLFPGRPAIAMSRDYNQVYHDGSEPIIHEMWHHVDAYASWDVAGQRNDVWFSKEIYRRAANLPVCGTECMTNNQHWIERPWENFAVKATEYTRARNGVPVNGYSSDSNSAKFINLTVTVINLLGAK